MTGPRKKRFHDALQLACDLLPRACGSAGLVSAYIRWGVGVRRRIRENPAHKEPGGICANYNAVPV
jgi:hypothetical protein